MQNQTTNTATSNPHSVPHRTVRDYDWGKQQNIIDEIAVNRALSALCGGSGVGQAPEPPRRAETPAASFLPVPPKNLQDESSFKELDLHGFPTDKHGYQKKNIRENPSESQRQITDNIQRSSELNRIRLIRENQEINFLVKAQGEYTPWYEVGEKDEESGILNLELGIREKLVESAEIGKVGGIGEIREIGEVRDVERVRDIVGAGGVEATKEEKKSLPSLIRKKLGKLKESGVIRQKILSSPKFALQWVSIIALVIGVAGAVFTFGPVVQAEIAYKIKNVNIKNQNDLPRGKAGNAKLKINKNISENPQEIRENPNSRVLPATNIDEFADIKFVSDVSIAIPKIEAYAEIVPNVDPSSYGEYMAALQTGVAHAKGTTLPGQAGNSYLFAHSAGNLFDIARFNAVFYLISKLEKGDAIYIKFGNEKFKYTVLGKIEVDPTETRFLGIGTSAIGEIGGLGEVGKNDKVLTLQTCTPPGTDWRRLLVFAKIEE